MNMRNITIAVMCAAVLALSGMSNAAPDDYIKKIDIVETEIDIDNTHFPFIAYLFATLKNNSDKKVSNITFQVSYYDKDGCLIKKAVVKNALNDPLPVAETRKYRIKLKGDVVNIEQEQYPFSQSDRVSDYNVKILSVKLAAK